jgi:hypothetical protein
VSLPILGMLILPPSLHLQSLCHTVDFLCQCEWVIVLRWAVAENAQKHCTQCRTTHRF